TNLMSTGSEELDKLLKGGIPQTYPVILTTPFCDERDQLIQQFLEKGLTNGEIVFYICAEISGSLEQQINEYQNTFFVLICNPQADMFLKDSSNVFKLKKGIMNLTEINIALSSAIRKIQNSSNVPRRICISLISDVLLQHQTITTKNWLTGLIGELKSQNFTTLAVMNPLMHSPQDVHAILGLFDGEISLEDRKTARGSQKILKINRMYNQKYLSDEVQIKKKK
ncbi:MAG: ATPase domain-containing protein, partial [Candidatus Bathyarchaeota archaeon]